MKKIYLLVCLLVLSVSCQKDEITSITSPEIEESGIETSTINIINLTATKEFSHLKKFLKNNENKSVNKKKYQIVGSIARVTIKGSYKSYTFQIKNNYDDKDLTENLVMVLQKDGTFKSFILTYNLKKTEEFELLQNKDSHILKKQINYN